MPGRATLGLRDRFTLGIVIALMGLLFTPWFVWASDFRIRCVTMDVVNTGYAQGEPGQESETSPYSPSRHFCAVNETPFVRENWWNQSADRHLSEGLTRYVYLGVQNVTSVLVEVMFRTLTEPITMELFGSGDGVYNATTAEANEIASVEIEQPIGVTEDWLYRFSVCVRADGELDEDVLIQSFRVWVSAEVDLCPVAFSLERPDGESLLGYARSVFSLEKDWHYANDIGEFNRIQLSLGGVTHHDDFHPWHETDIVYLKPGNYSGALWWNSYVQRINVTLAANTNLRHSILIPASRLNITCMQRVLGYTITVNRDVLFRAWIEQAAVTYVDPVADAEIRLDSVDQYYVYSAGWIAGGWFHPEDSGNYDVIFQLQQPQFGSTTVMFHYLQMAVYLGCLAAGLAVFLPIWSLRHANLTLEMKLGLVPLLLFVVSLFLPWSTWSSFFASGIQFLEFPGLGMRTASSGDLTLISIVHRYEFGVSLVIWFLTLLMASSFLIRKQGHFLAVLSALLFVGFVVEVTQFSFAGPWAPSASLGPGPLVALLAAFASVAILAMVRVTRSSGSAGVVAGSDSPGEGAHQRT